MNDKFFDLKKEKQDKMINGAMEVFARKGYKLASTDDMVKVAGVSKGLWFHYFGNKAGLYTFISDYCIKYLNMELTVSLMGERTEYFDILYKIEETKASIAKVYPFAPLMVQSMLEEDDDEIKEIAESKIKPYKDKVEEALSKVDETILKEGVSKDILDMTVGFTVKGIREEAYKEDEFDSAAYLEKIKEYFDMMKSVVFE